MVEVLIALYADTIHGEKALRKMVTQLKTHSEVLRVSSIYNRQDHGPNGGSELVAVLMLKTELAKEILLRNVAHLKTLEPGFASHGVLLTFGNLIQLVPGATLPDPRFLQDFILIQCAAEIAGEYVHPIVAKTLNEILRSKTASSEAIEFFAQGRVLL